MEEATVYCSRAGTVSPILRQLEKLQCRRCVLCVKDFPLVDFTGTPASLIHPLIKFAHGSLISASELAELECPDSIIKDMEISFADETVDTVANPAGGVVNSLVKYLDEDWVWAELFLKLVETFGVSVCKSVDDPRIPIDYLIACMRRNLGIETYKDGQVIIEDLVCNGILVECKPEEYMFHYHMDFCCLNRPIAPLVAPKQLDEESDHTEPELSVFTPTFPCLVNSFADEVSKVFDAHSVAFLLFVDRVAAFSKIEYDASASICVLMDLLFVMNVHMDLLGLAEFKTRSQMYYHFLNQKVHVDDVLAALKNVCDDLMQFVKLACAAHLRWRYIDNPKFGDMAVKVFSSVTVREIGSVVNIPSVLKPIVNTIVPNTKQSKFYDLHLSPF